MRSLIEAAGTEAGCEVYSVSASESEPGVFWFFELYTDADALAVHGMGDEMKAAMGALGGLLGARPEITRLAPLAAKGLTLSAVRCAFSLSRSTSRHS